MTLKQRNQAKTNYLTIKYTGDIGLFVCLGFMAYQIYFYTNKQFYFKQFSLALVHNSIDKHISISSYSV